MPSLQFRRATIGGGLPQPRSLKKAQKGHARTYHDRVSFISVMVVLALNICFFPNREKKKLPPPHFTKRLSLPSFCSLPLFPFQGFLLLPLPPAGGQESAQSSTVERLDPHGGRGGNGLRGRARGLPRGSAAAGGSGGCGRAAAHGIIMRLQGMGSFPLLLGWADGFFL